MDVILDYLFQIIVSLVIFVVLVVIGKVGITHIKHNPNRIIKPTEYLPKEEIKTLKQVYYLILMMILFLCIMNFFFDNDIILHNSPEFYVFNSVIDIIISCYLAGVIYDGSKKSKVLVLFLFPLASIAYLLFGESMLEYWDFMRIPALLYLIKMGYGKFKEYTDEHKLGKSIMLLFSIVFFSFIITIVLENENPLDSLVMVSNAFTSNGYAILGNTTWGKIDSIILVWSGYIISGAATATLAAAIIIQHYTQKIQHFEKEITEIKEMLKELKEKE
jgi:hypothetical protein